MPFYLAYFSQSLLLLQERTLLTLLKHHLTQTNPDTTMPLPDHVSISRHCLCPRYIACLPSYPALSSISGSGDSEPAHNRRQAEIPRDSSDLPTARFVPRFLVNVSLHLRAISLLSLVQPPASISICATSSLNIFFQLPPESQSDLLPALSDATHSGSVSEDEVAILEKEIPLLQVLLVLPFDAARW
jgi:hypothetical protein